MGIRNLRRLITATVAGLALAPLANAATNTGTLTVNATIVSACVVSATTLNFGSSIDPTSAVVPLDATSTMTVLCTATTPYTIALNAGANAGGASNFSARAIKNGTRTLAYQLYSDLGHTTVWGDGTATSSTTAGTGLGTNQSLTIYGRLPSLSGSAPGLYTDTVTVTISY